MQKYKKIGEYRMDKNRIEAAIKEILLAIGEDPNREGLLETPKRVANMYEEIFSGICKNPAEEGKLFMEENAHEMVLVKDIAIYSMCEHHIVPFFGTVNVAYLPKDGKILGLSKIARIVEVASKQLQLQERLCNQVADAIVESCDPKGVLVSMEGEHLCMTMRGIKKPGSKTITLASRGVYKQDMAQRQEVLFLMGLSCKS